MLSVDGVTSWQISTHHPSDICAQPSISHFFLPKVKREHIQAFTLLCRYHSLFVVTIHEPAVKLRVLLVVLLVVRIFHVFLLLILRSTLHHCCTNGEAARIDDLYVSSVWVPTETLR